MDTSMIIEAVGYIGSALVLISFLMVSVVKLRVVNSIGSVIFTVYAFIIHSYPTAIMNLCLVIINIYYLIKLSNTASREYAFVKANISDALISYSIKTYSEDIKKCFPGVSLDFNDKESCYVVCHKGTPAGFLIGVQNGEDFDIHLDYSIPEYRDFSIGAFLFSKLPGEGIKKLFFSGNDINHKAYLSKSGFIKENNYYVKSL